ncbi:hypothetical protein C2845_PM04G05290 [Panicum miliaceum]|uniref:F-box domain-containing protein n=1 Tax=Panicum miliaceum TaxID=4540 RepID=A0A3L6QRB9_PANMI|nr:hypothetical protein C2845_PM04G05290 [Panicum miliaceum]
MAPSPSKCSRPDAVTGVLPVDALYEILLPLPAKDLCRLRAVSRAWRSLLFDPQFIAAHGARHPGPLVVAGHPTPAGRRNDVRLYIMDFRGCIVKRFHVPGDAEHKGTHQVLASQGGLVCISSDLGSRCRLLDPATGAVSTLPAGLAEEHAAAHGTDIGQYWAAVVCGKVAATGEHKVLRVLEGMRGYYPGHIPEPLCEVLTLDGGGGGFARSRGKQTSPDPVRARGETSSAVVDGIVYLFVDDLAPHHIAGSKRVASFDLGTEEWRRTLQGP